MKQLVLLSFFLAVLLASCAPPGESPEKMVAEAKALDLRWVEAYNKGDLDAVMATYWNSPELISYPPGELELRGWEAVKEGFAKEFAATHRGRVEMVEINYKAVGDVVLGWGKWRYTMTQPAMEMMGRYSDVKAKRDGKWVFIMDHASAPMPPPPAAGAGN